MGDQTDRTTLRTTVDITGYGGWVQPRYPFVPLVYRRYRGEELIVPRGLEIVSCFEGGSLQAAYLSKATFDGLDGKKLKALSKLGLWPDEDKIDALEDILREHDQRQIIHVNRNARKVSIYQRTHHAEMPLYAILTYFSMMRGEEFSLSAHRQAAFEEELQRQTGVRPFHLTANTPFITVVQAEAIRAKVFPGVDMSSLDLLRHQSIAPHRNEPYGNDPA